MYEGQRKPLDNGMKISSQHRFGVGKVCAATFSYVYKIFRRIEKWRTVFLFVGGGSMEWELGGW